MDSKYAVILTTCANDIDAKIIIDSLLNKRLAACIQLFHVNSYYTWKGSVANDTESILFIKCKSEDYKEIEADIIINHKYETPEIIKLPITDGYQDYMRWIEEVT